MLGQQDEITTSYLKCCSDLKEALKIRLNEIYDNCKDCCRERIPTNHEEYIDDTLNPLVYFERSLLQYIRIKKYHQNENKTLQMKIKELQIDLRSKDVCIFKLKEDIVSYFRQIEFLRRHNEKLENDLLNSRKKINQFEKSKDWLKERIFSIRSDMDYKRELIYPEKADNIHDKEKEKQHSYFNRVKGVEEGETIDEFRKFHGKLMDVYHENIFLKRTLQKMKSLSDRELRLNNILKSSYEIPTVTKLEDIQKNLRKLNTNSEEKKKNENEQILELNSIIDCMKITVLQLEFEKRNMELSVFKINEYFMEMKDIQAKLKLMLSDKNRPFNISVLKSSVSSNDAKKNSSIENRSIIEELITSIRNLKLEKLQMEIEHHEELSTFTEKFSRMQYFLHSIKEVCDNISNDNNHNGELIQRTHTSHKSRSSKKTSENTFSTNDKVEIKLSSSDENSEKSTKVTLNEIPTIDEDNIVHRTSNAISQLILRRIKLFEEQYERIVSTCSKNQDLLRELNERSSIPHLRRMKVLALVKEKQLTEQSNRFEKYKRCLLSSLKRYRQSCIAKTRQYDELQELYIPIIFQLKFLKNYFTENESSSLIGHKQQSEIIEVIQKIEDLTENIEKNIGPKVNKPGMSGIPNHHLKSGALLPEVEVQIKSVKQPLTDVYYIREKKLSVISSNLENPIRDRDIPNKNDGSIITHSKKIDIQNSHIEKLQRENSKLQVALRQRDHLLGTIFKSFKKKLDGFATEINDKYFLQRLCNDLRSVIKIYGGQNRIMKEALENNNICTKSIYIQNTLRRNSKIDTEEHVRELLKQQTEFCKMKETFSDIHSHLESMKKDVSLLQNVINKR